MTMVVPALRGCLLRSQGRLGRQVASASASRCWPESSRISGRSADSIDFSERRRRHLARPSGNAHAPRLNGAVIALDSDKPDAIAREQASLYVRRDDDGRMNVV